MVKYFCDKCLKEFKQKSHYDKHKIKKNTCKINEDKLEEKIIEIINKKEKNIKEENKNIKTLCSLTQEKNNYNEDITKSKQIMKDVEIHKTWSESIDDEKYKKYINLNKNWKNNLKNKLNN